LENNLYKFTDNSGSFKSFSADKISSLYLPLCNEILMSSISPDLGGDIKSSQNNFLLEPVSRVNLSLSKASRNFWLYIDKDNIWSATGVSKEPINQTSDNFMLEAGQLWQKVSREHKKSGLKAEILSFVPAGDDALEIMQVTISNQGKKKISFTPYAAIPLYCRSADNIRDHRHVTSLLTRIGIEKYGIKIKPTLLFDEAGHHSNPTVYFAAACDSKGRSPQYIYPTQEIFCGDSGDLEAPQAVFENRTPPKKPIQGREPMAALRFSRRTLSPGAQVSYIVIMGISQKDLNLTALINRYNRQQKINACFKKTIQFWSAQSKAITVSSSDKNFDNWLLWVNIQPFLRKIFGCSFLPDFDYGRGGRGWRDLWQDCLGLILNNPGDVRQILVNNFCGVKTDGSNATIIGKNRCDFIADRNNISRVWMDHGIWPMITLKLYIDETGDFDILFEPAAYFRNHQLNRSKIIDYKWDASYGTRLKARNGKIYQGTVLEHLLIQNLVQFYNVGSHNQVRLEGADWNDGLDMAKENGESVAFSSMYAENLSVLAKLILETGRPSFELAEEIKILLAHFNYADIKEKHKILEFYFSKTGQEISGKKARLDAIALSGSLKEKSIWMKNQIEKREWLKEGFFNGYYDNRKKRVEGRFGGVLRMSLASQVFPVMSGLARPWQVKKIISNVLQYLYDKSSGGIRLNTDFKKEMHDLGRAFSFSYGDKENGSVFSHMVVMFANGLYKQNFAKDGWTALSSLYRMAANTDKSKVYPCLPEYFDISGRGMYSYLTGSASWFMLTLLTQAFGVKGENGDLLVEPKLVAEQFKPGGRLSLSRTFAGRKLKVTYINPKGLEFGQYRIKSLKVNSENFPIEPTPKLFISKEVISSLPKNKLNMIEVLLG